VAPVPRGVDFFGRKVYGQMEVDIDEKTLTAVAQKTGGEYFRADNTDTLRKIYERIDTLEKSEVETKKYVQIKELFHWVVAPGLGLLLLEVLLGNTVWRKLP
jgi:Ca-activated chloride channel family protein